MAQETRHSPFDETVRALALETGVTEEEIRDIVSLVGIVGRASIVKAARILRGDRRWSKVLF